MSCISLYQAKELISCVNRPIICKNDCFVLFLMFPSAINLIPRIHGSTIGLVLMERMLEIMQLCNITYQLPILHYDSTTELANIIKTSR